MPLRKPYRALLIDVPRTGNYPERMAREVLPDQQRDSVLEMFSDPARLIKAAGALVHLEGNWYVLITEATVYFGFAPTAGVSRVEFDRINIAAKTSTIPAPWADETEKIKTINGRLPVQFRTHLY